MATFQRKGNFTSVKRSETEKQMFQMKKELKLANESIEALKGEIKSLKSKESSKRISSKKDKSDE